MMRLSCSGCCYPDPRRGVCGGLFVSLM
uniref:Uncharacterized protein n=1 Tax=Zea mays TaxID=4577 RepID=B4G283_MAIZE|nr:unknown [Zea mays]